MCPALFLSTSGVIPIASCRRYGDIGCDTVLGVLYLDICILLAENDTTNIGTGALYVPVGPMVLVAAVTQLRVVFVNWEPNKLGLPYQLLTAIVLASNAVIRRVP